MLLGGPEGGPHFNLLVSVTIRASPCVPATATQWLTCPEGVANGAALATDTLILARCFSE